MSTTVNSSPAAAATLSTPQHVSFHIASAEADSVEGKPASPTPTPQPLLSVVSQTVPQPPAPATDALSTAASAAAATAPAAAAGSIAVSLYNTPKETLVAVTKAGMAKAILPMFQLILLGFNAGLFLSFGNLAGIVIGGGLSASSSTVSASTGAVIETVAANPIWARFAHACLFPLGLVLIVLAGSELFTGNVMYMSAALFAGKIPFRSVVRNLTVVWLANLAGSAFCAFFLAYLTELVHTAPQRTWLESLALKKMADSGWGRMFLKGVGCNMLVCIALWCNLTARDIISKLIAIWVPITCFLCIGWEHSIANQFTLPLALMEGVKGKNFGDALAWNLIPVTLGNMLGGFLFILGQFLCYGSYAMPRLTRLTTKHHQEKQQQASGKQV